MDNVYYCSICATEHNLQIGGEGEYVAGLCMLCGEYCAFAGDISIEHANAIGLKVPPMEELLCAPTPGQYNPTISEERKETIERLTENRSLYGITEVKKKSFFERLSYWLKTKWKFKIQFTVTKIPPVDMRSAHWPEEVVKEMMKMERAPIEYNRIGGK
jgi:hypothetical protein